jgi:hypothetical protein
MSPCGQLGKENFRSPPWCGKAKTNPEIAAVLGSTEHVVDKLGVWSRLELALYVASHGGARWAAELVPSVKSTSSSAAVWRIA